MNFSLTSSDFVSEEDHLQVTIGALRHELERLNREKYRVLYSDPLCM